MDTRLCVGTCGMSVWFSDDFGESWTRPYSESGLYLEARVWALSWHPDQPDTLYAGTDAGVYRWSHATSEWSHLPSPMNDMCVWSLVQAPHDPKVMYAGTQPAMLYRSRDGGRTWQRLSAEFPDTCMFVHKPRVTQILCDPLDRDTVWAGVEIGGVWRSRDAGDTWHLCGTEGLLSDDIHGLAIIDDDGRKIFATTNKGLHVSTDDGETWRHQQLDSPWQYTRVIQPAVDGNGRLLLANGNGPPGSAGRLLLSENSGEGWHDAGLPGPLNSTPWCIATNPADSQLLFVVTNLGQLFRSTDGGKQWVKLDREFGEVRAALWHPAA